jgi:hypothetical protein
VSRWCGTYQRDGTGGLEKKKRERRGPTNSSYWRTRIVLTERWSDTHDQHKPEATISSEPYCTLIRDVDSIAELLGQLQQAKLGFDDLLLLGHHRCPS